MKDTPFEALSEAVQRISRETGRGMAWRSWPVAASHADPGPKGLLDPGWDFARRVPGETAPLGLPADLEALEPVVTEAAERTRQAITVVWGPRMPAPDFP